MPSIFIELGNWLHHIPFGLIGIWVLYLIVQRSNDSDPTAEEVRPIPATLASAQPQPEDPERIEAIAIADFLLPYCGGVKSKLSVKWQLVTDLRREAGWIKKAVRALIAEQQHRTADTEISVRPDRGGTTNV